MASWRLLSSINSVNLLCIRKLATTQDPVVSRFKRSIEKDILPPKPKKPLNPFLQYFQSVKIKLKKEYPDCKYQEIVKKASEQWAQVEPTLKQSLQKQYVEQQSIYKQQLTDYKNSITDDQKIQIKRELMKKEDAYERSQIKQKLAELGKPKRPLTAFFLFMQSKRALKDPQIPQHDWLNGISNEWKNMPTEVKHKYTTEATQLSEEYKIELKKWEKDMIRAECPNQSSIPTAESIATNLANIGSQNREDIDTGWGTDDTMRRTSGKISSARDDQRRELTKSLVIYNEKNNLKAIMRYPRDAFHKDTSINDVKQVQHFNMYGKIHKYFVSVWKTFLTFLKETRKNWKMVREYIFIGTSGIIISIFCILNLMYK